MRSNYIYTTDRAQHRAPLTWLTPLLPCFYEIRPANFYQGLLLKRKPRMRDSTPGTNAEAQRARSFAEGRWELRILCVSALIWELCSLVVNACSQSIPTGLRPSAQGWRPNAYLGFGASKQRNANGVVAHEVATTALRLGTNSDQSPGSRFAATWGFETQPRWGSPIGSGSIDKRDILLNHSPSRCPIAAPA
jgi:hypothetical protein